MRGSGSRLLRCERPSGRGCGTGPAPCLRFRRPRSARCAVPVPYSPVPGIARGCWPLLIVRVEVEDLARHVFLGVDAAHVGAYAASCDPLDRFDEVALARILHEQSRVPQPLVFAHLNELPFGGCERGFERRDEDVWARVVAACPRRPTTELLLVEPDHLVRELRQVM